ncbi:MAG: PadR family transcriptional regulator [Acidobacteria bacterium]|nr:PadR family transcriptional regulator [Acidobacteriota bacterium]
MTYATAAVLQALDAGCRHGFEIIEAVGVRSGTVYPVLRRLEEERLVRSRWEPVHEARNAGRPPRRYYELTAAAEPLLERARSTYPAERHLPALGDARG